jgi:large subunit ribosomal protein L13
VKSLIPKADPNERKWFVVDADGQVLGRLASQIAYVLKGKHKPQYTPHLDMGDHIVVVNAEKIRTTGRKVELKQYTRYTGYPGGLRVQNMTELLHDHPERVLTKAVRGMLPKNRLGRKMIKKLRIYAGPEHPHSAQQVENWPTNLRKA